MPIAFTHARSLLVVGRTACGRQGPEHSIAPANERPTCAICARVHDSRVARGMEAKRKIDERYGGGEGP